MYYILEIQQYADGSYGHLIHWAETRNQAESKYHQVLAAAAISELPSHAASMFSSEGFPIMNQCYKHEIVTETTEPENQETPNPLDI